MRLAPLVTLVGLSGTAWAGAALDDAGKPQRTTDANAAPLVAEGECPLFPVTPLLQAATRRMLRDDDANPSSPRRAHTWARVRWETVDAWAALQDASVPPLQGEEAGWAAPTIAGLPAVAEDESGLDAGPPLWEVKRLEQTTRFSLARLG